MEQERELGTPIIECENVSKTFMTPEGEHQVVKDLNIRAKKNEFLVLFGPGQCGKTTIINLIAGFEKVSGGMIKANGEPIKGPAPSRGVVFQSISLFPWMTTMGNVEYGLKMKGVGKKERQERAQKYIDLVGLQGFEQSYPVQLSGGMKQRVGIARALAVRPEFVVCDEPISALDVSIQAQVVNMLEDLQAELGLTYLFIAHDLSMVRHISRKVGVMYLGSLVEVAETEELYEHTLHPYTKALMSAVPELDPAISKTKKVEMLKGDVPSPINSPKGCKFCTRCPYATERCKEERPILKDAGGGHMVACHLI